MLDGIHLFSAAFFYTYQLLQELIEDFKQLLGVLLEDSNQKPVDYFQGIATSRCS